MKMEITLKIKPDPKAADVLSGLMKATVERNLAKIKQIEAAVADIRDPTSGEGPKVTWKTENGAVLITIDGSEFVKKEAERRVADLPVEPPI